VGNLDYFRRPGEDSQRDPVSAISFHRSLLS